MRLLRFLGAVTLSIGASVIVAHPAHAFTPIVSVGADGVVYLVDVPGNGLAVHVEKLTATTVEINVHVYHPASPTAGPGCTQSQTTFFSVGVICTFGGPIPTVHLDFGDERDLCVCEAAVSYEVDFGPGDDELHYLSPAYPATIFGGDGDDVFENLESSDQIDGGPGHDTVNYSHQTKPVLASLKAGGGGVLPFEHDIYQSIEGLGGGRGDDVLIGDDGPNKLVGRTGNDTIHGEGGDDLIEERAWCYADEPGCTDDDTFHGGDGEDTVSYFYKHSAVNASINGVRDDGMANEKDLIELDVENLIGSEKADTLVGSEGPNKLYGTGPIFGKQGDEDGGDFISGMGGNDILYGYRGADLLLGGEGNDRLVGGADGDSLYGGAGRDYVSYESHLVPVVASLDGQANDGAKGEGDFIAEDVENLNGGIAGDTLYGNDDSNVIVGDSPVSIGGGNDRIYAGGGNDKVYAGAGNDYVAAGDGNDTVYGSWGDDKIYGEGGNDLLDGGPGTDLCDVGTGGGAMVSCSP